MEQPTKEGSDIVKYWLLGLCGFAVVLTAAGFVVYHFGPGFVSGVRDNFWGQYDAAFKTNFIASCRASSGGQEAMCECLYQGLEESGRVRQRPDKLASFFSTEEGSAIIDKCRAGILPDGSNQL